MSTTIAAWLLAVAVLLPEVSAAELPKPQEGPSGAEKKPAAVKQSSAVPDRGARESEAQPGTVYLDKSLRWKLSAGKRKEHQGQLAREIVRQALLLAAREELGLTTRDAWLGDAMPAKAINQPLDLAATPGEPSVVKIVAGSQSKPVEIGGCQLDVVAGLDYRKLAIEMERLSREKFVDVLRKAGFSGKPNPQRPDAVVPQQIGKLLDEMTFTSQYQAVRQLHGLLRTAGESPPLLGALARGYANLGMLTEFHLHPAHKVFKARGLLYAQRMLVRAGDSPWARWHRAYALALAGLHRQALEELEAAGKLGANPAAKDGRQPPLVDLMEAHCRYDFQRLDPQKADPSQRQLAYVLLYEALVLSADFSQAMERAIEARQVMPECYRVHDGATLHAGVAAGHEATLFGLMTAGRSLYARIAVMPELPPAVRQTVGQRTARGGFLARVLGSEMPSEEEYRLRPRLVAALRAASSPAEDTPGPLLGTPAAVLDRGEPSWAALGHLIEELSFVQVWRRAAFERNRLATSPDEFLAATAALVADHPYRAFIESFAWDQRTAGEALQRLAKVELDPLDANAIALCQSLWAADSVSGIKASTNLLNHLDEVPWDLVVKSNSVPPGAELVGTARALLEVSPFSPMAKIHLIDHDWKNAEAQASGWEKEAAQHPSVLTTLGHRYMELERYADAERCLKAAVGLSPEYSSYDVLAALYRRQNKRDQWLAVLEEYLRQPSYGLEHAQVRAKIVRYYIGRRQWQKALPYAEQAAETYSSSGLTVAAECHEGLQDWQKAEAYFRANALRYRGQEFRWHQFCARTGQGDINAAREAVRQHLKNVDLTSPDVNRLTVAIFYLLEGESQKALTLIEPVQQVDWNPFTWLLVALLADQQKDPAKRDNALKQVAEFGRLRGRNPTPAARRELVALGALLADDLAKGGKVQFDLDAANRLRSTSKNVDYANFSYFLGKYLGLHGKDDLAVKYWTECMAFTSEGNEFDVWSRTLAGAELLKRGVTPAAYRALVQTPEPDDQQQP